MHVAPAVVSQDLTTAGRDGRGQTGKEPGVSHLAYPCPHTPVVAPRRLINQSPCTDPTVGSSVSLHLSLAVLLF